MYGMTRMLIHLSITLALISTLTKGADQYDIDWHTFDGPGIMWSSGDGYDLAGTVGQPDAGTLSGGTATVFALTGGFWVGPVGCTVVDPLPNDPDDPVKNRYISFMSYNSGLQTAIQVTFTSLPGYEYAESRKMWVQEPFEVTEASGSDGATPPPTFWAAELGCGPFYTDWSTYNRIDVYGAAVVPGATFDIRAIDETCDTANPDHFSLPLQVGMSLAGDVVGGCAACPCTSPDGVVDFVDISAVVEKFKNVPCNPGESPGVPRKARADVINSDVLQSLPDRKVDFVDISCVVEAFRGAPCTLPGPPIDDPCVP